VLARAVLAVAVCAGLLTACTATVNGRGTAAGRTSSGAPTTPPPASASQAALQFTDCTSLFDLGAAGVQAARRSRISIGCARLAVPLDYTSQTGRTISIEVVKVHDKRNKTARPLLVNPGGPGASGVSLAVGLIGQVSDRLLAGLDIVGFDPRGVGLSAPINCVSDAEKDRLNSASPDIRTAAGFAQAKAYAAQVAHECGAKYGTALPHFTTVDTARDMDVIRAGLGQQRLSYLGFSYGTELGAAYAHLFPAKVGNFVLDGAVDPLTDDIASFANQLGGFEDAFDQFAADCRSRPSCASLGDPRSVVEELTAKADANPIPNSADSRTATSAIVLTGVISALYSSDQWPALGNALKSALNGDSNGLFTLADNYNERNADGTYATNIYEANTAISCNDSPAGPSDALIRTTVQAWAKKYPIFGVWAASSLFSCQQWQPIRTPVPKPTAATPNKVLVVGNLHDPATPYQGAKDLTQTLGNAELLTWDGEGHTSYLSDSSCIDGHVDTYLLTAKLPPAGTTCPR
jgi:pimeloyl-ACP methyl ester carboxylesterase